MADRVSHRRYCEHRCDGVQPVGQADRLRRAVANFVQSVDRERVRHAIVAFGRAERVGPRPRRGERGALRRQTQARGVVGSGIEARQQITHPQRPRALGDFAVESAEGRVRHGVALKVRRRRIVVCVVVQDAGCRVVQPDVVIGVEAGVVAQTADDARVRPGGRDEVDDQLLAVRMRGGEAEIHVPDDKAVGDNE